MDKYKIKMDDEEQMPGPHLSNVESSMGNAQSYVCPDDKLASIQNLESGSSANTSMVNTSDVKLSRDSST